MHLAAERAGRAGGSDREGAVAALAALHRVATDQYPGSAATWDALLARGPAGEPAAAAGRAAADALLAERRDDGWDGEAAYVFHPMAPGVYAEFHEHSDTPQGFVFGAGWAQARPLALESADAFPVPPPPAIGSAAYTEAYREVKSVGRHDSATRTADQAHLAMWWKEFVESSHNRLARELVEADDLDFATANRMLARLNAAIFDAYVAVFDAKFRYNHWRPYTAIRWAEHDGNPDTEPDPDWDNLHRHTYPFPSYPSAHGTACAAAMTVLADTFGAGRPFAMRIPEVDRAGPGSGKVAMDPPVRSFASFAAAAEECSLSRVYLGIHFRYDSEAGTELGNRVGRAVLERL